MQDRYRLHCVVCQQQYGACLQCSANKHCFEAFHPLCAREAGLHMTELEDLEDDSSDDTGSEAGTDAEVVGNEENQNTGNLMPLDKPSADGVKLSGPEAIKHEHRK